VPKYGGYEPVPEKIFSWDEKTLAEKKAILGHIIDDRLELEKWRGVRPMSSEDKKHMFRLVRSLGIEVNPKWVSGRAEVRKKITGDDDAAVVDRLGRELERLKQLFRWLQSQTFSGLPGMLESAHAFFMVRNLNGKSRKGRFDNRDIYFNMFKPLLDLIQMNFYTAQSPLDAFEPFTKGAKLALNLLKYYLKPPLSRKSGAAVIVFWHSNPFFAGVTGVGRILAIKIQFVNELISRAEVPPAPTEPGTPQSLNRSDSRAEVRSGGRKPYYPTRKSVIAELKARSEKGWKNNAGELNQGEHRDSVLYVASRRFRVKLPQKSLIPSPEFVQARRGAIFKILEEANVPLHPGEILQRLHRVPRFKKIVYQTLANDLHLDQRLKNHSMRMRGMVESVIPELVKAKTKEELQDLNFTQVAGKINVKPGSFQAYLFNHPDYARAIEETYKLQKGVPRTRVDKSAYWDNKKFVEEFMKVPFTGLTPSERSVLENRILAPSPQKLKEISRKIGEGITRQRVSQIEESAKRKAKEYYQYRFKKAIDFQNLDQIPVQSLGYFSARARTALKVFEVTTVGDLLKRSSRDFQRRRASLKEIEEILAYYGFYLQNYEVKKVGRSSQYPGNDQFASAWEASGKNNKEVAEVFGVDVTTIFHWRKRLAVSRNEPLEKLKRGRPPKSSGRSEVREEASPSIEILAESFLSGHITVDEVSRFAAAHMSDSEKVKEQLLQQLEAEVFSQLKKIREQMTAKASQQIVDELLGSRQEHSGMTTLVTAEDVREAVKRELNKNAVIPARFRRESTSGSLTHFSKIAELVNRYRKEIGTDAFGDAYLTNEAIASATQDLNQLVRAETRFGKPQIISSEVNDLKSIKKAFEVVSVSGSSIAYRFEFKNRYDLNRVRAELRMTKHSPVKIIASDTKFLIVSRDSQFVDLDSRSEVRISRNPVRGKGFVLAVDREIPKDQYYLFVLAAALMLKKNIPDNEIMHLSSQELQNFVAFAQVLAIRAQERELQAIAA